VKAEVARFVEEMLRQIRQEFYPAPTWGEKRFYQERRRLIEAITWPARWMNARGIEARPSIYRRILDTVIRTIRGKGNVRGIRCFSVYFLHSVQEHLKYHGDEYYYEAKAAQPIGDVLPAVTRNVGHVHATDRSTQTLSQLNQILRSKGGRRRRDSIGQEGDLFSPCKRTAAGMQNVGKDSQTFAVPAKTRSKSSNLGPVEACDSESL
jgi:hypothetical protein